MTGNPSKSREATRRDVIDFFGKLPPSTIRARVLERDGEVIGIAGYWVDNGVAVVFSDYDREAGITPARMWKEAVVYMRNLKMPARCLATPGSEKFLTRLGWVHTETTESGEMFEWHL